MPPEGLTAAQWLFGGTRKTAHMLEQAFALPDDAVGVHVEHRQHARAWRLYMWRNEQDGQGRIRHADIQQRTLREDTVAADPDPAGLITRTLLEMATDIFGTREQWLRGKVVRLETELQRTREELLAVCKGNASLLRAIDLE